MEPLGPIIGFRRASAPRARAAGPNRLAGGAGVVVMIVRWEVCPPPSPACREPYKASCEEAQSAPPADRSTRRPGAPTILVRVPGATVAAGTRWAAPRGREATARARALAGVRVLRILR
jgi:hypothetical protein